MKSVKVKYLDRMVDKDNFRTFVYGLNGQKKLVKSWNEFQSCISSGLWIDSFEENIEKKPKVRQKRNIKQIENVENIEENDGMVFEVKEDGA